MRRSLCALGRWRAPPFDAPPLREKLRVEGAGFERAFGFVLRPDRINFSRIRRAQEDLAGGIAGDARNLRGAGLGEMGKNAVTIDGQKSAAVTRPGQEAAVGSQSERVDNIFTRRPKLFRRAVGTDAVTPPQHHLRERTKDFFPLDFAP